MLNSNPPASSPSVNNPNPRAGFTIIELMVVLVIIAVITFFSVGSYINYSNRTVLESGARQVRTLARKAQNNAKNGIFSSIEGRSCYVNYDDNEVCGGDQDFRVNLNGNGSGYDSCLEMVASNGIVLESWGIRGFAGSNQVQLFVDCRYRYKPTSGVGGAEFTYYFSSSGVGTFTLRDGNYRKSFIYENTPDNEIPNPLVEETISLPAGVTLAKNIYFEFNPYYLNIKYPIVSDPDTGDMIVDVAYDDGQPSPSANSELEPRRPEGEKKSFYTLEAPNEIVLTINDGEDNYFYKFPIELSGTIGSGCFCSRDPKVLCRECLDDS